MKKTTEEKLERLTDLGAHRFIGWMRGAAKHSPRIAKEIETFCRHVEAKDAKEDCHFPTFRNA
jgi:hypothetical protein